MWNAVTGEHLGTLTGVSRFLVAYPVGKITDHYDWKPMLDSDFKVAQVASFAEDADGELYVISLDGTIFKMVPK